MSNSLEKHLVFLPLLLLTGCFGMPGASDPALTGNEYGARASLAEDEASTAISALLQNDFGQAMAPSDHKAVAAAQAKALRMRGTGAAVSWRNIRTGHTGEVRPGPVYQVNETVCREVTHEMTAGSHHYKSRGTACQEGNGAWGNLT